MLPERVWCTRSLSIHVVVGFSIRLGCASRQVSDSHQLLHCSAELGAFESSRFVRVHDLPNKAGESKERVGGIVEHVMVRREVFEWWTKRGMERM